MLEARRRWTGDFEYAFQDQSSLLGAAILGQISQSGRLPGSGQVPFGRHAGGESHERNRHRQHDIHRREGGGAPNWSTQAKAGLEGAPTLAILFATSQYDTEVLCEQVSELLGGIPMWGGSSSTGVFRDDGWVTSAGGAASLMLIADRPGAAAVVPVGDDPFAAGRKAAEEV